MEDIWDYHGHQSWKDEKMRKDGIPMVSTICYPFLPSLGQHGGLSSCSPLFFSSLTDYLWRFVHSWEKWLFKLERSVQGSVHLILLYHIDWWKCINGTFGVFTNYYWLSKSVSSSFTVCSSICLQKTVFVLISVGTCNISMRLSPFVYFLQKVIISAQVFRTSQRKLGGWKLASHTWVQFWVYLSKAQYEPWIKRIKIG